MNRQQKDMQLKLEGLIIAALIVHGRSRKQMSQRELAEATGMSRATINKYESGASSHSYANLKTLSSYLGFGLDSVGVLIGETKGLVK